MKKFLTVALLATTVVGLQQNAEAAAYASDLNYSATAIEPGDFPIDLSYRLNDDATTVTVEVLTSPGSTVVKTLSGPVARGQHNVSWDGTDNGSSAVADGDYTFRVNVLSADSATTITDTQWFTDTDPGTASAGDPFGVTINNNPDSEYFGYIYVAHNRADTATNNLWAYPADMGNAAGGGADGLAAFSFAPDDASTSPTTGGINWDDNGNVPRYVAIDEDDFVYANNWFESGEPDSLRQLWRWDADGSNPTLVLANSTNPEYSDATKFSTIQGTGTDKSIYLMDGAVLSSTVRVLKWTDTDADGTWADESLATSITLTLADDPAAVDMTVAVDADENYFVVADEGSGTGDHDIAKYDSAGNRLWARGSDNVAPYNFQFVRRVALWPGVDANDTSDDVLIIDSNNEGSSTGITILDTDTGEVIHSQQTFRGYGSFDVLGNLYASSQAGDDVKMSLLQGSIIDYTTNVPSARGTVTLMTPSSVEGWMDLEN